MKRTWAARLQALTVLVAIGLVSSFFLFGMVGGQPADQPVPSADPTEQTPPPVDPDAQPGVPAVPVEEQEMWELEEGLNPDRQLDYRASSDVDLPEALGEDLAAYWEQVVAWGPCDGGALCATIKAPLDWDEPGRAAVEIAMRKVQGGDEPGEPVFVNPGGPGPAGQFFADTVADLGWDGRDIIAWDPRGTGESTSVDCGPLDNVDAVMELDSSPDDAAEEEALREGWAKFARDCRDHSGELLDHLTTIDVIRDLDLMRHLVGAEKLDFFGVSYGTFLGSVYAELFPERTGRLLLDSAVNITDDEDAPAQIEGFELSLNAYAEWCATNDRCTFGATSDEVVTTISDWLAGLDAEPVEVGDRVLTQGMAATGILAFLYADEEAYESLTWVIMEGMQGRGEYLLQTSDELDGRETHFGAFPAMACVDGYDEGADAVGEYWAETIEKAPVLAPHAGIKYVCEFWTADTSPQLKLTAEGAPPIIVVGTTGDSATPYEHAVGMAESLASGVLVTYEGAGHGSVTGGNPCLEDIARDFFVDGVVPDDGTTCS